MQQNSPRSDNRVLARLSTADFDLLVPHLEAVDLPVRRQLECRNKPITHAYFLESGFASVVIDGAGIRPIEVGLIGREGMSGLAIVMAVERAPHEMFMQYAGNGQRITVDHLNRAMRQRPELRCSLLRYAHLFLMQATETAAANGRGKIEGRLARWLLMAHDRIGTAHMALTHEFLAMMLGVRRPGVTVALGQLAKGGNIRASRGTVTIVDRDGLIEKADGSYGQPEAEEQRLFAWEEGVFNQPLAADDAILNV